tara:strand:+ start:181877 stop:183088 length:1212 start_codon:yes stop_codon:yes gene_type:complete
MSLLGLIKENHKTVLFGFITLFFVGLGQTFFIAQFNYHIISDLKVTRTELSFVYSLATFLASFNLSFIGSLLDRISLKKYLAMVMSLMTLGFILLSNAFNGLTLFIAFYFIRGFGQVPLGMMATTTVSRFYGEHRGKILMLIGFGRSISEGVLPLLCIFLFSYFSWRESLLYFNGLFLALMLPVLLILVPLLPTKEVYADKNSLNNSVDVFTWKDAFRLKWPILVMIANAFVPFVMTALFFQQDTIAALKGWDISIMAKSFTIFSLIHILGNFIWGPLIDKVSARKLQPFILFPFLLGIILLSQIDHPIIVYFYMGLVGLSIGLGGMVRNTFWAEVYGTKVLGKIKGMDSNIIVIGTSIAPIFYSLLLDFGLSVKDILYLFIIMTGFIIILYFLTYLHYKSYK